MKKFTEAEAWAYEIEPGLCLRGQWFDNPSKPVIHFMHGNGFCGGMYWPFLQQFTDDYALFLHNVQGHGESDNGQKFPGWKESVRRIGLVIDAYRASHFGDRPVIGMGHSFGSMLTFIAACRQPSLFSQTLLLDPVFLNRRHVRVAGILERLGLLNFHPMVKQAKIRGREWASREAAWTYFYQRGVFEGWSDESLAAYIEHALNHHADGSLSLKCPPWMEARIFGAIPHGIWRDVPKLRTPTRVFYGDESFSLISPSLAQAQKLAPMIEFSPLPGGHCFMQEFPDDSAAAIREWLHQNPVA